MVTKFLHTWSPDFGSKCEAVLIPAATHSTPVSGISATPVTVSLNNGGELRRGGGGRKKD